MPVCQKCGVKCMDKEQAREKFKLADRLFNEQQFGPALKVLTELNSAFPNERHILYPMARCLTGLGRNGEALDLADRIVRQFDYAPAMDLYKKLKAMKSGDGLAALESGSDPVLPGGISLDSDPVVNLPPGVPTLDSDPVMPPPGMPKFDSDPPPLPRDLDALVSGPFGSKTAVPPPVQPKGNSSRAVMLWVGLAIFAVLINTAVSVATDGPITEYLNTLQTELEGAEDPGDVTATPPMGAIGITILTSLVTGIIIYSFAGYGALRVTDALPFGDFGEDMKDIALYTLFGTLLSPIVLIGWIIFMVLLKKHYDLSFGKLLGVVALWFVFAIVIAIPIYVIDTVALAMAAN